VKDSINNIKIKAITCLLLAMMGTFIANNIIFIHSHQINDGKIITHSHPYNKKDDSKPYKSHHHTTAEFLFLENLKLLFPIIILIIVLLNTLLKADYKFFTINKFARICVILPENRAPPVL
jgi:Mn2+/Fe2+ NRAMP family transporter